MEANKCVAPLLNLLNMTMIRMVIPPIMTVTISHSRIDEKEEFCMMKGIKYRPVTIENGIRLRTVAIIPKILCFFLSSTYIAIAITNEKRE